MVQKDVGHIQDPNKDTLFMIYVENKITTSTNVFELIDLLSKTIEAKCAHLGTKLKILLNLDHKVIVLFLTGETTVLPDDLSYKRMIVINKQILPRIEINRLNVAYTPLLIDYEMIA